MTVFGEVGPAGRYAPRHAAGETRTKHGKKPPLRLMEETVKDPDLNLYLATRKSVVSCIQNSIKMIYKMSGFKVKGVR